MSVNLSPVAGAAAQFLDNSGNVLTGGKLYTYAAGTTTPQATYTSAAGTTFHSNPIILDAAGRVPSGGEIWLSDNASYKFVLKDANDVLIGTWDNLIGINSNFVNYSLQEETFTATQGQTVFTLSIIVYTPSTNTLGVYVNGSKQIAGVNYIETNSTTVTFVSGLNVGDVVDFTTAITLSAGVTTSDLVSYTPPFTGSVATNVRSKLAQYVSVKDFGAKGDGVTNDTVAIQAAISSGYSIDFPTATYVCTGVLILSTANQNIRLNGSHLIVEGFEVQAESIVFDLGGGIVDQNCRFAKVATVTSAGSSTVVVDDSSNLIIGQTFLSSWGDDLGDSPLIGPSDPNPHTIQSIVGNTITLNKPLYGAMTLPVGLNVGNFIYTSLFELHTGSILILNGVIQKAKGYYANTPIGATVGAKIKFQNIDFASNGLDQFLTADDQTFTFSHCNFAKNLDVGKSGVYIKNRSYVYMDNCNGLMGNYDSAFIIANFGVTYTGGELSIINSNISGLTEINPSYGYYAANNLHPIVLEQNGTFDRITVSNCQFSNFSRAFISSTATPSAKTTSLGVLVVDNSSIAAPFAFFNPTGSGNYFICRNATITNSSFYVDTTFNGQTFCFAGPVSGATSVFTPQFDNCFFSLAFDGAKFATKSSINNSVFNATAIKVSYNEAYFNRCRLLNGSTVAVSPNFSSEYYGTFGEFIVDNATNFPSNPSAVFNVFNGATTASGATFGKAKSINGSTWYNVYKLGTDLLISGDFNTANNNYFLSGDDYYIPIGSRIIDTFLATTSKVTFNLQTTLTTAATAGATSVVVASATGIATGDKLNILCTNGLVSTVTVGAYVSGLTIPISALGFDAANGSKVNFFRVV
jgi:hypothetical protein